MRKVAAHTDPLIMAFRGGPVVARMVIAELKTVVHVVADGLHPLPAARHPTKERPSKVAQLLSVAVSAAKQENEHVVRQPADRPLLRINVCFIRQATVTNYKAVAHFEKAGRRHQPGTDIAEAVEIIPRRHGGREFDPMIR